MKKIKEFMENGNAVYGTWGEMERNLPEDVEVNAIPCLSERYYTFWIEDNKLKWDTFLSIKDKKQIYELDLVLAHIFIGPRLKLYYKKDNNGNGIFFIGYENLLSKKRIPKLIWEEYTSHYPYMYYKDGFIINKGNECFRFAIQKTYSPKEFGEIIRCIKYIGKRFSAICRKYRNMGIEPMKVKEIKI